MGNRDSPFSPNTFKTLCEVEVLMKVAVIEQHVIEIFNYPNPHSSKGVKFLAQQSGLSVRSLLSENNGYLKTNKSLF